MRRLARFARQVHQVAGPAGTLMLATVLVALIASIARASDPPAPAAVPPRLAPGDAFTVTVRLPDAAPLQAYLPGLDLTRTALRFDPDRGAHVGGLVLPWFAPDRGRATLRIVGEGLKLDVPLSLQPPPAAS
ncbi:MAG: hypothetical protein H6706_29330 [Myxococcales bacterium]|nr:hypothetical protein [Myxococcales bacterium]